MRHRHHVATTAVVLAGAAWLAQSSPEIAVLLVAFAGLCILGPLIEPHRTN